MDSQDIIDVDNGGDETPAVDVEMSGEVQVESTEVEVVMDAGAEDAKEEPEAEAVAPRVTFIEYVFPYSLHCADTNRAPVISSRPSSL